MEEFLDFIEFPNEGYIAVRGHLNLFQFKEVAEEYLNEDEDDNLYIVDDVRHLYGRFIVDGDQEYWSWGYGQDEDDVVAVTVGEYFSALHPNEEEQGETHIFWDTFISNN